MRKKVILATTAFLLTAGAYFLLSHGDETPKTRDDLRGTSDVVRQFVTPSTTEKTQTLNDSGFTFSPGETTVVRVYDDTSGRKKYQFTAKTWEPIGDEEFHVTKLQIQIFMPRGEITHISADEADITVARKSKGRVEAQRGTLTGNVKVVIDRTDEEWRAANPELAAPDSHPDQLIHIDMESARFDMDRAELFSDGAVTVDSREARIQDVSQLTVQWDQVDNRIDVLRFQQGGKMVLRSKADFVSFSLPGSERRKKRGERSAEANHPGATALAGISAKIPKAKANQPLSISAMTADEAAGEIRFEGGQVAANRPISLDPDDRPIVANAPTESSEFRSSETLTAEMEAMKSEVKTGGAMVTSQDLIGTQRKKIHTYRAVFNKDVLVERREADQTVGELEAQLLEVHFDFGSQQKRRFAPGQPSVAANKPVQHVPAPDAKRKPSVPAEVSVSHDDDTNEAEASEIILTWNGPLELRPIPAESARPTGKRFDVIATGNPVKVRSIKGNAVCEQLVYRNERRQAWLSGSKESPVELSVGESRKLQGLEVFFDEKRGLAHVNGPGSMTDSRENLPTSLEEARRWKRETVEIQWSRGVDLELGKRTVQRVSSKTGLVEEMEKEYLRRAWFHGDVHFKQNDEQLIAEEVAATFFFPTTNEEVADHIEHLNTAGYVSLKRGDELIQAERLDMKLIVTSDGRNLPRLVDATGNVLIQDPKHNLKISRAESLKASLRNGNNLVQATIVSRSPDVLARVRHKNMAIHGHRIEIDGDRQSIDVPGPGKSWVRSWKDFSGQALKQPTDVKTTWSDRMQFRMAQDYGVFVGNVVSASEDFRLDCDKLTIRFAKEVKSKRESTPDFFDRAIGAIRGDKSEDTHESITLSIDQKRPTYIVAEGNAEAIKSERAPSALEGKRGRLLSRLHITGRQIVADLAREQMSVPSKGTLLIEDYQFNKKSRSARAAGPLMSSLRSEGPSQTAVGWESAMDFFVDRKLIVFDKNVTMEHRSGKQMVRKEQLIRAMGLDATALNHLPRGRRTTLSCGNLTLEFRQGKSSGRSAGLPGADVRATDLEHLIARNAIHLKDGTKSLMGEYLQYMHDTNEIRLEGSDTLEARIIDEEERSQRLSMWRGPLLIWNRETNRIEAPRANIRTSRR